ncbi:MAG: HD domain-containing phosphohydrolase [Myxococcota bacterium]
MPVEPSEEGRLSVPGEPSPVAQLAGTLKIDPRIRDSGAEVEIKGRVVEVRRGEATVVVVRVADLERDPVEPYLDRLPSGKVALLLVGDCSRELTEQLPPRVILNYLPENCPSEATYHSVRGLLDLVELRQHDERKGRWIKRYRYELGELVEIARALSQERDITRLLDLILEKSRFITGADAGSIYVIEGEQTDGKGPRLRFKTSQNESVTFESSEFTMPVSMRSIAGAAALTRLPINIPNVDAIPDDAPYSYDSSFDKRVGYDTRSMIAVPMISAQDEVIGIIQLINKKKTPGKFLRTAEDFVDVVPFGERDEELLVTLASQAGIALENALLYEEIRGIFEGFVRASVQAIEQRDPTTSGHSLRVSVLSCSLAAIVDRVDNGPYATSTFTRRELKELEYAALLHDFGKIGVREKVLVKAKKLYPHELQMIQARFAYLIRDAEANAWQRVAELRRDGAPQGDIREAHERVAARRAELEGALKTVLHANEPTVLKEGDFSALADLATRTYIDAKGDEQLLLTEDEVRSLQVTRGSLNGEEMAEIRSHVVHTFNFLSRIPWGKTMARIPEIAGAHHEKLDGSGYPHGIGDPVIPLQSKIMTIADIYDALTARDRPYKKAIPVERALAILGYEVKDGHIDGELVRLFTEAKVFESVQEKLEY